MSWTACKEHPTKQPSTSRLPHYQHFTLIWRDQRHTGKSTWALSIMVETLELLWPLRDKKKGKDISYTHHELLMWMKTAHTCFLARSFILSATEQFEQASSKSICYEKSKHRELENCQYYKVQTLCSSPQQVDIFFPRSSIHFSPKESNLKMYCILVLLMSQISPL